MQAIQYWKSVPRYLTARKLGPRFPSLYTSGWACLKSVEIDPPPLPSPFWARVRPFLSGICGSDLASLTAKGSAYFSRLSSFPFVFGHEVVGEVTEIGAKVDRVKVGDRVVLQPPLTCRTREVEPICEACRAGQSTHCRGMRDGVVAPGLQVGFCRDTGGGWSESFVAHQLQLHSADDLSDEEAILVEPYSCSLHAVLQAPLADDSSVLVLGCGTMGALTIAAIRAIGSRCRLIVVAKHPHQQEWARRLGADVVVGTGKGLYPRMAELFGAQILQPELGGPVFVGGADVTFDCIASDRTLDDALRLTGGGGAVILVGMPSVPRNVDWTAIWYKELTVKGSYTADREVFLRSMKEVRRQGDLLKGMAGAVFSLDQYKEAIACALNTGQSKVIKTALRI